ncbi:hypothetical protein K7432_009521, partial [Basidiobolus ranarum]
HSIPPSLRSHSRHDSGVHHGSYEQPVNSSSLQPSEVVTEEYFMHLPSSPALVHSIENPYFQELVRKIKHELNISLNANTEASPLHGMHSLNDSGHCTFGFKYERRDVHKLPRAQQILKDYLESSQISFFNSGGLATNGSYDIYPRRMSSNLSPSASDSRPIRDNRSYSLFDLDAGVIFEPNTQRRNTYTSLNMQKCPPPPTNQSSYQHRRYSSTPLERNLSLSSTTKDSIWLPHDSSSLDSASLSWLNNGYGRAHMKNKLNTGIWTEESFLPFEMPGPMTENNSADRGGRRGPSSLYSGYYGF